MSGPEENNLTEDGDFDIMPTANEKRILTNLRRYAKMYPFSDLAVLFSVHNGELKNGLLCLGKGADSNIKL